MTNAITTKKAELQNSKKGFTLVELVVVIAILAILAAIAIPVVNSIINTASKNGALSNGQTIELAIKECQADITSRNDEVYSDKTVDGVDIKKASTDNVTPITLNMVATVKGIKGAFKPVNYNGATYSPFWDKDADKCIYLCTTAKGSDIVANSTIDGDPKTAYSNASNCEQLNQSGDNANVELCKADIKIHDL